MSAKNCSGTVGNGAVGVECRVPKAGGVSTRRGDSAALAR